MLPPPRTVPTLTSISPASGNQGQMLTMTLNGSGFQQGATVIISGGDDIAVNVTSVTNNQITAAVTISPAATTTSVFTRRNVTVTNPNGQFSVLTRAFSVNKKQ